MNQGRFYQRLYKNSYRSPRIYNSTFSFKQHLNHEIKPLIQEDVENIKQNISNTLIENCSSSTLPLSQYYFNLGKNLRPTLICLFSRASNLLHNKSNIIYNNQLKIATYAEMVHTASLLHDDVVDRANLRRRLKSANIIWGQKKPVLGGNLILALASKELAKINDPYIISILSQILLDMVNGELMQLGTRITESERFSHYFQKTYNKTASLISNSAKCVSYLSTTNQAQELCSPLISNNKFNIKNINTDILNIDLDINACNNDNIDGNNNGLNNLHETFYEIGKHIGLAFQIRDDILDIKEGLNTGKSNNNDMAMSGLANAPLLFACDKFPEIDAIIVRKFSEPGDIQIAMDAIRKSNGIDEAQNLVVSHIARAKELINGLFNRHLKASISSDFDIAAYTKSIHGALLNICDYIVTRES